MDRIEDIWDKGNEQIAQDGTFSSEEIRKSISESSAGITSILRAPLYFGVMLTLIGIGMFTYNLFFYHGNLSLSSTIVVCIIVLLFICSYQIRQIGVLNRMDGMNISLRELLIYKIKYLNGRLNLAYHLLSLSVVLVTFSINVTIERADGIFELNKILILSGFYLFVYVVMYSLFRLSMKVYDRQLRNALNNLEEQSFRSLDKEMRKSRRLNRIILVVVTLSLLSGLFFLFRVA